MMDEGGSALTGSEKFFMQSLKELSKDLTGDLVSKAIGSIQNNPNINTEELDEKIKKQTQKYKEGLSIMMGDMIKLVDTEKKIDNPNKGK